MNHDALAADLAAHLRADRRMVWCDVQLGPSGSPRPDVYAIFKSHAHPKPMAYECKVSLSDFRSDVTAGKWMAYLTYACGVIFAVEAGLKIGREDVPAHCGLMVRGETGWRAVKKPTLSPVTIPQDAPLKLLIDGVEREGPRHRRRAYSESLTREKIVHRMGQAAADYARDSAAADASLRMRELEAAHILDSANDQAEFIRLEAERAASEQRQLAAALGLPEDAGIWRIRDEVRRLRDAAAVHPAQRQLESLTGILRRALDARGAKPAEPVDAEAASA